jgi:hypothetical protein
MSRLVVLVGAGSYTATFAGNNDHLPSGGTGWVSVL